MREAHVPGLQAALIRDGKIVWHGSFGVKNAAIGGAVTDDTIFEAASLTKPFFAYYVMKLVDQGLLDPDKPLAGWAPKEAVEGFLGHSLDEPGFRRDWFEKITIRHILSHSAGTPHGESGRPFPLFFEPGTQWKYSADGYFLLQKVIESLKGARLEDLVRAEVLEPLGMTRSSLVWRDGYEAVMANGHDFFGTPEDFRKRTEAHAGASLYTTAEDYARFVCAVLDGEGLRPETVKDMWTSRVAMDPERKLGWCLGFGTQEDVRGTALWQWGDYGIFRNYVLAYPAEKAAVVYLTNGFMGLGIASEVTGRALGAEARGAVSLKYPPYDAQGYRFGWELARLGAGAAGEIQALDRKYPQALEGDGMRFLNAVFSGAGKIGEATALLRYYVGKHPREGKPKVELALALARGGDRKAADRLLRDALSAPEDKAPAADVTWHRTYVRALAKPEKVKEAVMRRVAGSYGPRRLEVRGSGKAARLWYFREGGTSKEWRPLYAVSKGAWGYEPMRAEVAGGAGAAGSGAPGKPGTAAGAPGTTAGAAAGAPGTSGTPPGAGAAASARPEAPRPKRETGPTFILEDTPDFRLMIVLDEQGEPLNAVGIYLDGSRDEALRTK